MYQETSKERLKRFRCQLAQALEVFFPRVPNQELGRHTSVGCRDSLSGDGEACVEPAFTSHSAPVSLLGIRVALGKGPHCQAHLPLKEHSTQLTLLCLKTRHVFDDDTTVHYTVY